jgi:hypothetical protein
MLCWIHGVSHSLGENIPYNSSFAFMITGQGTRARSKSGNFVSSQGLNRCCVKEFWYFPLLTYPANSIFALPIYMFVVQQIRNALFDYVSEVEFRDREDTLLFQPVKILLLLIKRKGPLRFIALKR